MISIKNVTNYCNANIALIENYNEAINSDEKYDCHHRLETDLNVSKQYLIDNNLYYNRPTYELIFMKHTEHIKLHQSGEHNSMYGKISAMKGRKASKETLSKMSKSMIGKNKGKKRSEETKVKLSELMQGENNPQYGKPGVNKGKHRVYRENGSFYMSY